MTSGQILSLWSRIKGSLDCNQQDPSIYRLFITGPSKSSKSSIAFRVAYDLANQGQRVLFACVKEDIERCLPHFVEDLPIHPAVTSDSVRGYNPIILNRIQMSYVSSVQDLIRLIASIQIIKDVNDVPTAVIIDDLAQILTLQGDGGMINRGISDPAHLIKSRLLFSAMIDNMIRSLSLANALKPLIVVIVGRNEKYLSDGGSQIASEVLTSSRRSHSECSDFSYSLSWSHSDDHNAPPSVLFHTSLSMDTGNITII